MDNYFSKSNNQKFRGRPRETLPLTLGKDVEKAASSD